MSNKDLLYRVDYSIINNPRHTTEKNIYKIYK